MGSFQTFSIQFLYKLSNAILLGECELRTMNVLKVLLQIRFHCKFRSTIRTCVCHLEVDCLNMHFQTWFLGCFVLTDAAGVLHVLMNRLLVILERVRGFKFLVWTLFTRVGFEWHFLKRSFWRLRSQEPFLVLALYQLWQLCCELIVTCY